MTAGAPGTGTSDAVAVAGPCTCTFPETLARVAIDADKLDCCRVAIEAQVAAASLVPAEHRVLRDQLERASLSVVLNISEGAGRRSRKDKRRHYSIARGSAMESAAAIDVIARRGIAAADECAAVRKLYVRAIQMLTKLDSALA